MFLKHLSVLIITYVLCADGTCPPDFIDVKGGCYAFLNNQPSMWDSARSMCQNLAAGADLTTFSNCTEFDNVIKFILSNVEYQVLDGWSYWIGGSDRGMLSWIWIDLEPMPMGAPYWGSNKGVPEPSGGTDQDCATMNKDDRYYIHDSECYLLAFPLCSVPPL